MRRGCVWALLLLLAPRAEAQVQGGFGEVAGSVTDPTGARIADASVRLLEIDSGIERTTTVTSVGTYRVELLSSGTYVVAISAPKFATAKSVPVEVRVGETTVVNFRLVLATASAETIVLANPTALEVDRIQQADYITEREIADLPTNRRNYIDFALLVPTVTETATLADGTDFRIPTTPASGLGFNGSNGRGSVFTVDGFQNNGLSSNVRPSIPQGAVQEFQVDTNSYSVEYGGGFGGEVNVVSKSGGDAWHGEAFGLLRNQQLEARNYFDPARSSFTRVQSGLNVGGPFKKKKTFLFTGFERLDLHQGAFVTIDTSPSFLGTLPTDQQSLFTFLDQSGVPALQAISTRFRPALLPTNNPLVIPMFQANGGVFPFTSHQNQFIARLDYRFSSDDSLTIRLTDANLRESNAKFGALDGFTRGSYQTNIDFMLGLENTWVINPRWLSVTRLALIYDGLNYLPNDPNGPAIDINGYGNFGRDSQYPTRVISRNAQWEEIIGTTLQRHMIKGGFDLDPLHYNFHVETFFSGLYTFGAYIPLGVFFNSASGNPNFSAQLAGTLTAMGRADLANTLNDTLTSLQAFSLGLPVAYTQGFGNPEAAGDQRRYSWFVEDTYQPVSGLTITGGLRAQVEADSNLNLLHNVDPRLGFAWDVSHNGRTVLRGGGGVFDSFVDAFVPYSATAFRRPDLTVIFLPLTGVPGVNNPKTGQPVTSADVYQELLAEGILYKRQVQLTDLTPLGIGPSLRFPTTGGVDNNFRNAYATQASLEVDHAVGPWTFSVSYDFSRGAHLPRTRDQNLEIVGYRTDGSPIFGRIDPLIYNNFVIESAANSFYHALVLRWSRRWQRSFTADAFYTFSRAIDEVTDWNTDYTPNNQLDARADRALSPFNQTHRLVARGLYESPWVPGRGKTLRDNLFGAWMVSAILQAHSGPPFNILTGYDNLGDGQTNTHRPWGVGRDTGIGPNYVSWDLRLARSVKLAEHAQLQMTGEAFNLLNRTNFESVNNVVGSIPASTLPARPEGQRGNTSDPFSFVSAFDPRQVQLGLRLLF